MDWNPRLAERWRTPAGGRVGANIVALTTLRTLRTEQRPATPQEQRNLALWSGWGAVPQVFDASNKQFTTAREAVESLLTPQELASARRTILNAHYTDPRLVEAVWEAVGDLGITTAPAGPAGEPGDGAGEPVRVLEPGSGSGTFIGYAPAGVQMVGVELDPTTAAISRALYPSATVRAESFADTRLPAGSFDAAVGNVPFGDFVLHDRMHNPQRLSIHNHFIVKALDLTRPGGIVAVLTSRYTMDAANPAARREMYDRADLVTAVRLPTGAHREVAGTEAVTDLVVFRVREDGAERGDASWLATVPVEMPRKGDPAVGGSDSAESPVESPPESRPATVGVNAWWEANPHLVLGQMTVGPGMHGGATLHVEAGFPLAETGDRLAGVLRRETARARAAGLAASAPDAGERRRRREELDQAVTAPGPVARAGDPRRFEGFLEWSPTANDGDGGFTELRHGSPAPLEVPARQVQQLRVLLEVRDAQLALLEAEAATPDRPDGPDGPGGPGGPDSGSGGQAGGEERLEGLRAALNEAYDRYVASWGPINTVTVSTAQRGEKTVTTRRRPAALQIFDRDPFAAAVRGLERYDEETGTAEKAAVMSQRVVHRRVRPTSATTADDALAIVLDEHAEVRLEEVARLLDVDVDTAREALGTLVYDDPADGRLVPRAEYLSGNVRTKLAVAQEAAEVDARFRVNVDALRRVLPRDLVPAEIKAQLGAVWIPAEDVTTFLREISKDRAVRVEHPGGSTWNVRGGNRQAVAVTSTWGTDRLNAFLLAERLMEQKPIVVHDVFTDADGRERRVINPDASTAAQEKADKLQEAFGQWVWADPARAERLARVYNDTFNSLVLRDYTEDGQRLQLPGLAATFTPHEHQRTAVARMIAEPSVGLYHGVGAGKTAEMVMGVSELRRLGLVDKPAVVVPNHMLEQVTREWLQLYPQARVLAASSADLTGERRDRFIARAATGDWDGVILTHTAFGSLPVAKATEINYIERELGDLRLTLLRAKDAGMSSVTTKQLEKAVTRREEQLKARLDRPRSRGLTFEQTGIDYLVIDELHEFKNLGIASNIPDVASEGSKRAADLDMKVGWLREQAGPRGRVMTGATATPIANSIAEAYVMQRYLRPDLLEAAGIEDFDAWAATFGSLVTELELTPEGGYRQKTRFARFDNLPELLRMWHVSADVKTSEQLALNIPALAERGDGQRAPEAVVVPRSPELATFMARLAERAEALRTSGAPRGKGEDNMLVVSTDGRKAALDLRMLDRSQVEPVTTTPAKVDYAAARIHRIWSEHRNDTYRLDVGTPEEREHPHRGGLQIVFADLGTPNPEHAWSFYEDLRDQLAGHGMDPTRIRFVQEASNDAAKARLFAACREGEVDVLVGSTATMGVGTNVQARAIALHHIDCPWRPADVEQREGRILRQGNQNDEVQVLRYVTEGSFDAFSWQTVERKQRFITQVMQGTLEDRSVDDDLAGSQTLSFSEVKALATGNPLILERAQAAQDATKLERLARSHERERQHRATAVRSADRTQERLEAEAAALDRFAATATDTRGDAFTIGLQPGQADSPAIRSSDRSDAGRHLAATVAPALERLGAVPPAVPVPAGSATLGGVRFDLSVVRTLGQDTLLATLQGLPDMPVRIDAGDLGGPGPIAKLENRVASLGRLADDARSRIADAIAERDEAQRGLDAPFPRADELTAARQRLARLDEQLEQLRTDNPAAHQARPATASPTASEEARGEGGRSRFVREREALRERLERGPDGGRTTPPEQSDSTESPRRAPAEHERRRPDRNGPSLR